MRSTRQIETLPLTNIHRLRLASTAFVVAVVWLSPSRVVAQRAPRDACATGQTRSLDTAGHCCWPGQVWSRTRHACVGVPQCPANRQADGERCVLLPCADGQVRTADTGEQCCWPGQAWSTQDQRCVGVPQCGGALVADGESCVSAPTCQNGQVALGSRCCWPGQTWSALRAACEGTPQCPTGLLADGETCAAPPALVCAEGQVAAGTHCCWPAQTWSDAASACGGTPQCPGELVAVDNQCTRVTCEGGRSATATSSGRCCWAGQAWDAARATCAGTPTACPEGRTPNGEDCALPPPVTATVLAAAAARPGAVSSGSVAGAPRYQFAWLAVGAAGILAAGGGGITWLMSDARFQALRTTCIQSGCPTDANAIGSSIRTLELASYFLWIGGATVTAVGLTLFLATPRREVPRAGQSAFVPALGGGHWLLHF